MENLRLGVSAVRHDMRREETVEEAEKNTELGRQTPKRQATGSNPAGGAKSTAASHFLLVCSVFLFCFSRSLARLGPGEFYALQCISC